MSFNVGDRVYCARKKHYRREKRYSVGEIASRTAEYSKDTMYYVMLDDDKGMLRVFPANQVSAMIDSHIDAMVAL